MGVRPAYRIEFYEDAHGHRPVEQWLAADLDRSVGAAVGLALNHILQKHGPDVCKTRYGKALGGGLFEFRLDESVDELLADLGLRKKTKLSRAPPGRMLFRVFFHPYGNKILLLLSAYDKGRADGKREQQSHIAIARRRLKDWEQRQPPRSGRAGAG